MNRMIDADELLFKMFNYYACVNATTCKDGYRGETLMDYEVADMIDDCIENAPTVDAVPVVHGEWKFEHGSYGAITCSICGHEALLERSRISTNLLYVESNYCPNCGADMRGKQNDS